MAPFTQSWAYFVSSTVLYSFNSLILLCMLTSGIRSPGIRRPALTSGKTWRFRFRQSEIHSCIGKYGTPLFILFGFVSQLSGSVTRYLSLLDAKPSCDAIQISGFAIYWAAKGSIYSVLISRVFTTFRDTVHRYSVDFIFGLYLLNALVACLMIGMSPVFFGGRTVPVYGGSPIKNLKTCQTVSKASNLGGYLSAIVDFFWTAVFIALFCRPLRVLLRQHRQSVLQDGQNSELDLLPVKYTVLCLSATLSTCALIVLGVVLNAAIIGNTDYIVNSICLILMTKYWDGWYQWMCAPFVKSVSEMHCCGVNENSDEKEEVIKETSV